VNAIYDLDINSLYSGPMFSKSVDFEKPVWEYEKGKHWHMFYRGGNWTMSWVWINSDIEYALSRAKGYVEEMGMDVKWERKTENIDHNMSIRTRTTVKVTFESDADALQFKLAVMGDE
jgi:hypothetical protein